MAVPRIHWGAIEPKPVAIIGVTGPMGAGKDAVAAALKSAGTGYEIKRFAAALRQVVSILTGLRVEDTETGEGKATYLPAWGMTVGQMLQRLGTDAVRENLHPDAWVLALFSTIGADDRVIISDVRFPNEVQAIRDRGGIIVRVTRPGGATEKDALRHDGRDTAHASETACDELWSTVPHVSILNTGTLEQLDDLIANVLSDVVHGAAKP
jgi:hypothetical protein